MGRRTCSHCGTAGAPRECNARPTGCPSRAWHVPAHPRCPVRGALGRCLAAHPRAPPCGRRRTHPGSSAARPPLRAACGPPRCLRSHPCRRRATPQTAPMPLRCQTSTRTGASSRSLARCRRPPALSATAPCAAGTARWAATQRAQMSSKPGQGRPGRAVSCRAHHRPARQPVQPPAPPGLRRCCTPWCTACAALAQG